MSHVLIIEDYSDTRDLTELILAEAGYSVSCADDGLAGLHCALHDRPDLILMDLNLPRMDGWQATRCLKGNPITRHIPVLAFTAYATDEACLRALKAGCEAIVVKPFDIDAFLAQVGEAITVRGADGRARVRGE